MIMASGSFFHDSQSGFCGKKTKSAFQRTLCEVVLGIQILPLDPVDHVSHQGVGDAGVGLLGQQDGLPQLIQGHGVPVHLLLPRLQLRARRGKVERT